MASEKSGSPDLSANSPVSVILEPLPEKSDDEVVAWVSQSGGTDAEILAPRFISATLPADCLKLAESVARVSVKTRKSMRP